MTDVLESEVLQEAGEWIDKEPREDGKPRRWKPSEIITLDPSRVFFQAARTEPSPLDGTQPHTHTSTQSS